jgi:Na+-transporting NADH:ubiquinone oxidoreductase subunit C
MAGSFFKERVWPVLFMVIITVVFISILGFLHILTADAVKRNGSIFLKQAILTAAAVPSPADPAGTDATFSGLVSTVSNDSGMTYAVKSSSNNAAVHVLVLSGPGLWGEIRLAVGLLPDHTLTGVSVVEQSETPGLGARITEAWFTGQFPGKKPPLSPVPEKEQAGETQFQAVTGATISSEAVRSILAAAPGRLDAILAEANR